MGSAASVDALDPAAFALIQQVSCVWLATLTLLRGEDGQSNDGCCGQEYNTLVSAGLPEEQIFENLRGLLVSKADSGQLTTTNGIKSPEDESADAKAASVDEHDKFDKPTDDDQAKVSTDQHHDECSASVTDDSFSSGNLRPDEASPDPLADDQQDGEGEDDSFRTVEVESDSTSSAKRKPSIDGPVSERVTIGRAGTTKSSFDLSQNLTPVFTTDVLTDPTTLKLITRYAEHHKVPSGVDLIRFWAEVDQLQHLPSHSYTHRRLRKIYDKFLSPEAPSPVCVTTQMLQEIEKALESDNISAGMYTDAQFVCFTALEKSVFPRFRDNKLFKKMQDFCAPSQPSASGSGSGSAIDVNNLPSDAMDDEDYSLMGVLNHPAKLRFLKTFCMEALALENLLFYLEVEDCKRLPNLSFITSKTRKIYDRYCTSSSRNYIQGIDVGGSMHELHAAVESKAPLLPKLFYEPQLLAFDRISEDIWRGFCRSQEYVHHSKSLQTDKKHTYRRANRAAASGTAASEQVAIAQQKLDTLTEVQLIEAAMHYPVEKLIPIKFDKLDRQSVSFLLAGGDDSITPQEQLTMLLGDPFGKKYFKQFMNSRGVDQLLAFCEEVEDFKLLPGIEYLQHSAKKIYRKYMMPSARLQVDMSTSMRDEIFMRLANPSVDMFKKISARVRVGMLQDSLPRFVKSSQYAELKKEAKQTPSLEQELRGVDAAAKSGKLELVHLDVFLLNQSCMRALRGFLEVQHCSENLMLWEEIEHFRRLPSYQIVLRSARKIYDKYLNPSNTRMVIPLSDALHKRVSDQLDVASRTTFDEVENECFDVMRNIVLPDFLDSRIFMALVGTWATVDDDYPADMLRGEFELAFLRHRFHLVQEARGLSRDASTPLLEKMRGSSGGGAAAAAASGGAGGASN